MRPSTSVPTALNRTKSSLALLLSGAAWLLGRLAAGTSWLLSRLVGGGRRLRRRAESVLRGPVSRVVRGPLLTFLLGRRAAVSVALVGLGALLGAVTAWGVAATTGYPPLEGWLAGTWDGTDPQAVVFVGGALLLALAAASAALNAGFLPTTLLVAGPLFGLGLTRYGTVVSTRYGQHVVSLPEALAFAFAVAAVGAGTLGVAGYVLGAGCRRAVRVVRADAALPALARRNED
ncbi:hypothetical protein [Haloplanus halophilus]|uniref:hypothetical protein n=1 Tax=Haloplanus halophilus TaxID=2949993 RepID=UPI00203C3832|nr:hypothetical protein [Haloplanus sp. GDY1]